MAINKIDAPSVLDGPQKWREYVAKLQQLKNQDDPIVVAAIKTAESILRQKNDPVDRDKVAETNRQRRGVLRREW